jgi:hypothetical protein
MRVVSQKEAHRPDQLRWPVRVGRVGDKIGNRINLNESLHRNSAASIAACGQRPSFLIACKIKT